MGNTGVEPSNVSPFRDISHRLNNFTLHIEEFFNAMN